jgi:hypothetical protein
LRYYCHLKNTPNNCLTDRQGPLNILLCSKTKRFEIVKVIVILSVLVILTACSTVDSANKKAIHANESCPPKYYTGDLSEVVDLEILSPYTSKNSDYKYDTRINFFPKQRYRDLEFYGGGIQHGYPQGVFSVMNFTETEDGLYAWILATKSTLDTIKIRLWFSNSSCHMAAAFMLSENEDIAELIKLNN